MTSLTPVPFPAEPAPLDALPDDRRLALLARILGEVSDAVALFSSPKLSALYLNSAALRLLLPTHSGSGLGGFGLHDFVGVGFGARLESEVLVHTRVFGRWRGDCLLRDEWGCEHPATATFVWHPEPGGSGGFISLRAVLRALSPAEAEAGTTDRDLLHALLETLPDDVYFKDVRGRFIRVSLAMARRDGLSDAAALIGRTDFDRFAATEARRSYEDEQRIIATGEAIVEREERVRRADGAEVWQLTTKLPLRDRAGRVVGTCGISRDITAHKAAADARRQLETQLQLGQKLEAIGRLAAGIAHEINTPSQFITDNIRFLRDAFEQLRPLLAPPAAGEIDRATPDAAELAYLIEEIPGTCEQSLDGLRRIARIVRSLKEFSHPGSPDLTPADLNHTIENVISVSRHEWKYVAELVTELAPDLPPVPCVVDEFGQAVLNLVINAAHAIEDAVKARGGDRGLITVRTRREGDHAVVEVADTGTGVPEAIRERVFEPFFTTKAVGRGTGQGLSIVQQIIAKNHRGRADFITEEGKGTTFRLWLPLAAPAPREAETAPPFRLPTQAA